MRRTTEGRAAVGRVAVRRGLARRLVRTTRAVAAPAVTVRSATVGGRRLARISLAMAVVTVLAGSALAVTAPAAAQESPYAGEEGREIKALSADEVAGYLAGAGMGFARAAELNHYPGPMHVIELADPLELDDEQRRAVAAVERRMRQRAVGLGRRLVDAEAALDAAFAGGTIDEAGLRRRLHEIADLQADLRHAHLAAHLETRALLRAEQVARYDELRGYTGDGAGEHPQHEHGHGHGHGGHPGSGAHGGNAP